MRFLTWLAFEMHIFDQSLTGRQIKLLVHDLQEERIPFRTDQLHDLIGELRPLPAS